MRMLESRIKSSGVAVTAAASVGGLVGKGHQGGDSALNSSACPAGRARSRPHWSGGRSAAGLTGHARRMAGAVARWANQEWANQGGSHEEARRTPRILGGGGRTLVLRRPRLRWPAAADAPLGLRRDGVTTVGPREHGHGRRLPDGVVAVAVGVLPHAARRRLRSPVQRLRARRVSPRRSGAAADRLAPAFAAPRGLEGDT